jgi:ABC-type lipoprotein export system ATPase subunit
MKITRLQIENFCQFKNLDLDLTYPKGHEKAGQPLDKICIIGQNGTGKTTILNIINDFYFNYLKRDEDFFFDIIANAKFILSYVGANTHSIFDDSNTAIATRSVDNFKYDGEKLALNKMLYFPFGMNSEYIANEIKYAERYEEEENNLELLKKYYYASPRYMLIFEEYIFSIIRKYQKNNADYRLQLVKKLELGDITDILQPLNKWQEENPNPLLKEAAYLDKLLNKFYLSTKVILDRISELNSIQLESVASKETIPYEKLSSGTRQILNVARPLYHLLAPNSIVLMDEPETSLYPDLQRNIIPYYTNLREDLEGKVQYIFSTHSPIVASSFDPWEVIDLEFDKDGFVTRHLYYEGENHIDNYILHPKYLRWDSILSRIFDLKLSGNEVRDEKIYELAKLRNKISYWKEQGRPTEQIDADIKQYKQLLKMMDYKPNNDINI